MKSTLMRTLPLAGLVGAGLLGLGLPATAYATPNQDAQYIACVTPYVIDRYGPSHMAYAGRTYANDIAMGIRTPRQEQIYVYNTTPADITQTDANAVVNCATQVWLGYGAEGPGGS